MYGNIGFVVTRNRRCQPSAPFPPGITLGSGKLAENFLGLSWKQTKLFKGVAIASMLEMWMLSSDNPE